jgi:hypothetical protein
MRRHIAIGIALIALGLVAFAGVSDRPVYGKAERKPEPTPGRYQIIPGKDQQDLFYVMDSADGADLGVHLTVLGRVRVARFWRPWQGGASRKVTDEVTYRASSVLWTAECC